MCQTLNKPHRCAETYLRSSFRLRTFRVVLFEPNKDLELAWYVGTLGKCGGELPPPDLETQVRAEFAKYTTTPVKFEKGHFFTTSGHGGNPFKTATISWRVRNV